MNIILNSEKCKVKVVTAFAEFSENRVPGTAEKLWKSLTAKKNWPDT